MSEIEGWVKPKLDKTNTWFAWYPVRTGALGTGRWVWLRRVWRNGCAGVTIYQTLDIFD